MIVCYFLVMPPVAEKTDGNYTHAYATKRRRWRIKKARTIMIDSVSHLVAPATLPSPPGSLSVLSYNVLLPNSVDGWWNYKMYSPALSESNRRIAEWDFRRDLLKSRISLVNADVVCLQEVAPDSFEVDFAFMSELGYDGVELFKKGRFRPATFWKTSKCSLATHAAHKDRTLLTAYRLNEGDVTPWFILNCHLQAGKEGQRRVRQIVEGTKAIISMAKKLKVNEPSANVRAIICGDFNGGEECGAIRFLEDGFIDSEFLEDGECVTSGRKELPLSSPFSDVMKALERSPPPTLVVPEIISQVIQDKKGNGYDNPVLAEHVVERLTRIYEGRASSFDKSGNGEKVMSTADVEKWLIDINGKVGRGDEYRSAAKQMGWTPPDDAIGISQDEMKKFITLPPESRLSLDGFIAVYQHELERGKFWGIHHDLAILGEPLEDKGLFVARFDRIYSSAVLQATAIMDFECDRPCPNETEPSDHLPVAACFVTN
jgi:exonuclease III